MSGEAPATRIFLSYRREDTSGYAGRLFDALTEAFGRGAVFMDIDTLAPGQDFVHVIDAALQGCEVALVLIGPRWLTVHDQTQRRLDSPDDLVRLEIEAALSRGVRVLPILVGGAAMPPSHSLPPSVAGLARRHAFELTDRRWRADVHDLVNALGETGTLVSPPPPPPSGDALGPPPPPPPPRLPEHAGTTPQRSRTRLFVALAAGAGVIAVAVVIAVLVSSRSNRLVPNTSQTSSTAAATASQGPPSLSADSTFASGAQDIKNFLTANDGKVVQLNLKCYDSGYPGGHPADSYCLDRDRNLGTSIPPQYIEVFTGQPSTACAGTCSGIYLLQLTLVSDSVYQNLEGAGSILIKGYFAVAVKGTEGNILPLNISVIGLNGVATKDVHQ
jgi:hypothetical protein